MQVGGTLSPAGRWDLSESAAWPQIVEDHFGPPPADYAFLAEHLRAASGEGVVSERGAVEAARSERFLDNSDSDSDAPCPYSGGLARISALGGSTRPKFTLRMGPISHSGERRDFAHSGPSGGLFGATQSTAPVVRPPSPEAKPNALSIPAGAIPVVTPSGDSLTSLNASDVKKTLTKRFRKGRCDASGLSKIYYAHVVAQIALKVTGLDKTALYRCCELDCTGTRLGTMLQFPSGFPPHDFDKSTFEPLPSSDSVVPSADVWPDILQISELRKPKESDAYSLAVHSAKVDTQRRSVLLAYLTGPILLSRIHVITTLVLDDCGLTDADAALLAFILRRRPHPTHTLWLGAESLREGGQLDFPADCSPPIRLISLRMNGLTEIGVMLLKKSVKYHPIIQEIRLEANNSIRCGDGFSIPPENCVPNPKFLIPFFDSVSCGGNSEVIELRRRLDKNQQRELRELQRSTTKSCLLCF